MFGERGRTVCTPVGTAQGLTTPSWQRILEAGIVARKAGARSGGSGGCGVCGLWDAANLYYYKI
jgi:hypothetical protein